MKIRTMALALISAIIVAGCGGGGGSSGGGKSAVSGKAADGYLVEATACLDINANRLCDPDEPSALTGSDGAFTIDVPAGVNASKHAIVVAVPETAVDTDTGLPVGKPFILSAPPGKSGFVSPLTTAVHALMERGNGALSADQAAAHVKASLGTTASVSLFEDYVEAKTGGAYAGEYARLHTVAQISARALADNLEAITAAATAAGLDPGSNLVALVTLVADEVLARLETVAKHVDDGGSVADAPDLVENWVGRDLDADIGNQLPPAAIVGTWHMAAEEVLITFLASGEFILVHGGVADEAGEPGMEYGTYDWNTSTKALIATVLIDQNGEWGLSHTEGSVAVTVTGDTLRLTESEHPSDPAVFSRVPQVPGSIHGSWMASVPDGASDKLIVLTFLQNGRYYHAETGEADGAGKPGQEYGTYTWNPATGALAGSPALDQNREWGLSRPAAPFTTEFAASGRLLIHEDEPDEVGFERTHRP